MDRGAKLGPEDTASGPGRIGLSQGIQRPLPLTEAWSRKGETQTRCDLPHILSTSWLIVCVTLSQSMMGFAFHTLDFRLCDQTAERRDCTGERLILENVFRALSPLRQGGVLVSQ